MRCHAVKTAQETIANWEVRYGNAIFAASLGVIASILITPVGAATSIVAFMLLGSAFSIDGVSGTTDLIRVYGRK